MYGALRVWARELGRCELPPSPSLHHHGVHSMNVPVAVRAVQYQEEVPSSGGHLLEVEIIAGADAKAARLL